MRAWVIASWMLSACLASTAFRPYKENEFGRAQRSGQVVLLHFVDRDCRSCDHQARILPRLLGVPARHNWAAFQVDVDRWGDFARSFGVSARPTLVLLHGAYEKGRDTNLLTEAELEAFLLKGGAPDPRGRPPLRRRFLPAPRP